MAVVLNKKNNVKLKIEAPMTSVSNLLIVDKGELLGDDFTSAETEKHFKGTLFKFDGENISQIEISKVITKSGNFLTLERAVEPCPMNYSSNQMYQQAYDFEAGDWFYINLTAGDLEDIITELKNTNTRIDTTNTNILNNYVSNAQLQAQKGQPGGIATLDQNGKVIANQIDTSTLVVNNVTKAVKTNQSLSKNNAVYAKPRNQPPVIQNITVSSSCTGNSTTNIGTFTISNTSITNTAYLSININVPDSSSTYNITIRVFDQNNNNIGENTLRTYGGLANNTVTLNLSGGKTGTFTIQYYCSRSSIFTAQFSNCYLKGTLTFSSYIGKASNTYTNNNFIGFAQAAASANANVNLITSGVVSGFSGLTIGSDYFLGTNGAITTTGTVKVGTAITTTDLLINPERNILCINVSGSGVPGVIYAHNLGVMPRIILVFGSGICNPSHNFPSTSVFTKYRAYGTEVTNTSGNSNYLACNISEVNIANFTARINGSFIVILIG